MVPAEGTRPRVTGDREVEVLKATLEVLNEVGYDKLTMDAVAARAKASKATLYRRWNGKESLVIEAFAHCKPPAQLPDTGTLRGDLIAATTRPGGEVSSSWSKSLAVILTALAHEPEFAEAFRRDIIGPKIARLRVLFERAQARGEIRSDIDLDMITPAMTGILLHRRFVLGLDAGPKVAAQIIDQLILPALSV